MKPISRRQFLMSSAIASGTIIYTNLVAKSSIAQAPAIITSEKAQRKYPMVLQVGTLAVTVP